MKMKIIVMSVKSSIYLRQTGGSRWYLSNNNHGKYNDNYSKY